jgi:hypothetical protein
MFNKLYILLRSIYGYFLKWGYDLGLLSIPSLGEREQADVIVSLTSYGRRVKEGIVCYSIYSILRQTLQPKRIILWLAEDEWTEDTLPKKVAELKHYGVEIRFCENMRSYKKLIPTLQLLPDGDIITVDDDVLYPSFLVKELYSEHLAHPKDIIAGIAAAPQPNKPYNLWQNTPSGTEGVSLFPTGVGGVYYPAHSLKKEMMDYAIAKQFAPLADDVWFWAAGIAQNTIKRKTQHTYNNVSFDTIYQYFHAGSALQHSNVKGNGIMTNDMQIAATMRYIKDTYGIG